MHLTKKEEEMLAGEEGVGKQVTMEYLVNLGDCINATEMVEVDSCHVFSNYICWEEELADSQTQVESTTTNHPKSVNRRLLDEIGVKEQEISKKAIDKEKKIEELQRNIGVLPILTCIPFLSGNLPMFGEYFSWCGSFGQNFCNTFQGARGNRSGGPVNLAVAITGRTPKYGLHFEENRKGETVIKFEGFEFEDLSKTEIAALSFYVGGEVVEKVPVFTDISRPFSLESAKNLTYPLSVSGATKNYHIVGITPEAPTLEKALGGNEIEEVYVNKQNIEKVFGELSTTSYDNLDLVMFGCPHMTLEELREVATLIDGRKVHEDVKLLLSTSKQVKQVAEQMGIADAIEDAGGLIFTDTCFTGNFGLIPWEDHEDLQVVATDSAKMAFYGSRMSDLDIIFGKTSDCINAAIEGKWAN